jgi:phosphatidylserine synthase
LKIIPNGFTLLGTIIGVSAVRFALLGDFTNAVYATTGKPISHLRRLILINRAFVVAAFVDGFDGPVARALHGTSQVGRGDE